MRYGDRYGRQRSRLPIGLVALVAAAVVVVAGGFATLRTGGAPTVSIESELPAIGRRTKVKVSVSEPKRGLAGVRVELVQGEDRKVLVERQHPTRPVWEIFGAPPVAEEVLDVPVGKDDVPSLRAGDATVVATALGAGTWLMRAPSTEIRRTFPVRLTPPSVDVKSRFVFVAQGGSEAVVYAVGDSATKHGVRAGEAWFPGYRLPGGGERDRFALFAVPYDLDDPAKVELVASDDVGNESSAKFIEQFTPRPFATDTIEVTDRFMETVVPRIFAETPDLEDQGSLLANYLLINGQLRRKNEERLRSLSTQTAERFLFQETFLRMPAKPVSAFADRRTYFYKGKEVDRQDHLGFDLASTQQAPVPAANRGVVVLAEYLGIYGKTVVIDHGYGLMTLYGHLSSIDVKVGESVARGHILGRTGTTGLAFGDHLHFTVMLQGHPVTPLEWWDVHWIQDRIVLKLGGAFPFVAP